MLRMLLAGVPVMMLCLFFQAVFVSLCLQHYVKVGHLRGERHSHWLDIRMLGTVMLLMLLGNFVQMVIWAFLFRALGEFGDFSTAIYHSAVNFATLGYGDIVLSARWRLLGPLEACNGILMFGVSTAVLTAAVFDVIKFNAAQLRKAEDNQPAS